MADNGYQDDDEQMGGLLGNILSPLRSAGIDPTEAAANPSKALQRLNGTAPVETASAQPPQLLLRPAEAAQPAAPSPPPPPSTPAAVTPSGNAPTPKTWADYARSGLAGQQAALNRSQAAANALQSQPDENAAVAPLEAQRTQLAQPINPQQQQYKPGIGTRIMRGIDAVRRGGVLGAVDPADVGGQAYSAPNKQFQIDTQKQGQQVASTDQQIAQARQAFKDSSDRAKAIATEQRAEATGFNDLTKNATGQEKTEADKPEKLQQLYADSVADAVQRGVDPSKDPTVQRYADAVTSVQKTASAKEPTRDDKAIAIYAKPPNQRTPDENAFLKGYETYVQKTKMDPGVARSEIFVNDRVIPVVDPNNPDNVVYQRAGQAAGGGASSPQSGDFQAQKALQKDFTSGASAKTLTAFNTATAHLKMLQSAADALQNGDIQGLNRIAQGYKQQTGSTAPTNFEMVKDALTGELSKTFTGGRATEQEIKTLSDAINRAQSPAQLRGVIQSASHLMESKRTALQQQYEEGKKGNPNFGESSNKPTPQTYIFDSEKYAAKHPNANMADVKKYATSQGYTVK